MKQIFLKPATISLDDDVEYWLGKTKPKEAFKSILNTFKKLLQNLKKILLNGTFY